MSHSSLNHYTSGTLFARRSLLASALVVGLLGAGSSGLFGIPAMAQSAPARTVDGTVSLKGGAPVNGAVVHLKDTRSLSQKSYITAADGTFHFAQLSSNTDYEVWADSNGKKTAVKSISSFDTKNSFTIPLKFSE